MEIGRLEFRASRFFGRHFAGFSTHGPSDVFRHCRSFRTDLAASEHFCVCFWGALPHVLFRVRKNSKYFSNFTFSRMKNQGGNKILTGYFMPKFWRRGKFSENSYFFWFFLVKKTLQGWKFFPKRNIIGSRDCLLFVEETSFRGFFTKSLIFTKSLRTHLRRRERRAFHVPF